MTVAFGGSPVATRRFELKPAAEEDMNFRFKTRAAGWLEARLTAQDTLDRTPSGRTAAPFSNFPPRGVLPVTVYSAEPDLLRPIFSAIPGIQASFLPVSSYKPDAHGGIVLLDHFAPPSPPAAQSIWVEPPADKSPDSGAKHRAKGQAESVAGRSSVGSRLARARHRTRQRRDLPARARRHRRGPIGCWTVDRRAARQLRKWWCSVFTPCDRE